MCKFFGYPTPDSTKPVSQKREIRYRVEKRIEMAKKAELIIVRPEAKVALALN